MRSGLTIVLLAGLALAACTASTGSDEALSKDEARARGGKSDSGLDFCEVFDWYGDGVCDDFCLYPDPDCGDLSCGGLLGTPCGPGQYCHYTLAATCGAADQTGTCHPIPEVCTAVIDPVCGCDGTTYQNECQANSEGVSVASWGACDATCETDLDCPQPLCLPGGACPHFSCVDGECVDTSARTCGGLLGGLCEADEFCRFRDDTCEVADNAGTCAPVPDACIEVWDPVCGCDGQTYGNRCSAEGAGVSVRHEGECEDDCRTSGCGAGRYCTYCWGTFQCIPDGAVC